MNKEIDIQYMRYRLADYYEDAGFADVYERELKNYSSEKIKELFILLPQLNLAAIRRHKRYKEH